MSDVEVNPLALPNDWGWQIGQRFLAGAQLCGFECEKAWVTSRLDPPLCCDPCQLAVFVIEDLEHLEAPSCCYEPVAHVLVMVDLCRPQLEADDPTWQEKDAETASDNAIKRGTILMGIRRMLDGYGVDFQESIIDPIRLTCANVDLPGQWSIVAEEGVCERWAIRFDVHLR